MSKLLKNMIWPMIVLGVLLAIVYYRAFLFTPDFNSPIDAVINEASESLNFKIPSHKLADNETPVYNKLFDQPLDENEAAGLNNTTEMQTQELYNAESQQIVELMKH